MKADIFTVSRKLVFVLFFLLSLLVVFLGMRYQKSISVSRQDSTISQAESTKSVITQDAYPTITPLINQYVKKVQSSSYLYMNPNTSISFQYSQNFYISGSDCSMQLVKNNNGSPWNPYIHIAIIENAIEQLCIWTIHSGQESKYEILSRINIGQSIDTGENKNLASFFTYKRMEDQIYQKNKWKLFVNDKVWEATETTKSYVYLLETPSKNIWIMGLVNLQSKEADAVLLDELKQVISSFQINNP